MSRWIIYVFIAFSSVCSHLILSHCSIQPVVRNTICMRTECWRRAHKLNFIGFSWKQNAHLVHFASCDETIYDQNMCRFNAQRTNAILPLCPSCRKISFKWFHMNLSYYFQLVCVSGAKRFHQLKNVQYLTRFHPFQFFCFLWQAKWNVKSFASSTELDRWI